MPAFGREATGQPGQPAAPGMLAYGPAAPRLETGAAPAASPFGHADVGENGTESRASAYSAALYGSYKLTDDLFIDALLGGSWLDFDSTRFVTADGSFAAGADYRTSFGGVGDVDGVFSAMLGVTF
ncbi:autotransporter domain-containing protein [Ancylobacter sp. TS-1]|uniref:autotransporter domain-containing protein n=1 Tax=Ancylobacter sp. TS-1 TaxID=1850374 RepID=UPI001391F702|nr:autotransporter domain-containing protein [Ancylobacter sp. TS-1]